ncbi:MAG: class I mannose-6-phosphate isomerase [Ruminococcus sp.]|nr:class I mannose-6-phosphate isomerase [Ruminococcus sp.]
MLPFELAPPVKDYIWGGTRLRDEFGKKSNSDRLAESWELSCHPDGESVISTGEFKGMTLNGFVQLHPEAVGKDFRSGDTFPVLVKLIDAKNDLSVQVHPDDEYAMRVEGGQGKTEMWYVVDCDEGASLIYGFRKNTAREEFRTAVENNTLMELMNTVPVKKGDVFFIEPGTVHAIGKGILIAEIQQSSNITYRVYDYGRLGADGRPRELHIAKALEVASTEPPSQPYGQRTPSAMEDVTKTPLASCRYFTADRYDISQEMSLEPLSFFRHILVIDGEADITSSTGSLMHIKKGSSIFVPAGAEMCYIKGRCSVIMTAAPYYKEEKHK